LRIIVAREMTIPDPFSVDNVALLNDSESEIPCPSIAWGEVYSRAACSPHALHARGSPLEAMSNRSLRGREFAILHSIRNGGGQFRGS
jgi:hypothetical protein